MTTMKCAARALLALAGTLATTPCLARTPNEELAFDIFKELVEINTVTATGDTAKAAEAMAARLRAAGFDARDIHVFNPASRKGNLVAKLRGTGARRPIILMAHLDVVEARREDWTTDPFTLVEKDGHYYGRGTGDDKFMAAAFVANLIRYKREGYRPERDLILVLATDEEVADRDKLGIRWLLANQRALIDAEYALNEGGGVGLDKGRPLRVSVQASEKVYANFRLEVRDAGGHSALPARTNAIYRLADGLAKLGRFDFPLQLNATTREYFRRAADLEEPKIGADMKAVAAQPPDAEAAARLSQIPRFNAQLRTTCTATMLEGGHAENALPQLARALVNCRVMPGVALEEVKATLVRVLGDDGIAVTALDEPSGSPPSPLEPAMMATIEKLAAEFWPGAPVIPVMSSGATDGAFLRSAGIPTYGHSGLSGEVTENRAHGRDERILVKSFYEGQEYLYRLVKLLAGG
ncbi:MAG TPA: M20/M25/M40 family metallo-hydrolase [Usitatibacter sp.]|nr:M20/M25/M40 family metallo-hydrolase [Usitatibacter sp.]